MIKGYDKFDANINKTDHIYPSAQEVSNFDFIISAIQENIVG